MSVARSLLRNVEVRDRLLEPICAMVRRPHFFGSPSLPKNFRFLAMKNSISSLNIINDLAA